MMEKMHKLIEKEKAMKAHFLYQQTVDESSDEEECEKEYSQKSLIEENPIQGLRWLKSELNNAMESHSKSKLTKHIMNTPSEEVKELIKKPEFKRFLQYMQVRLCVFTGKWVIANIQEYLLIKDRLEIVQSCIRSTVSLNNCRNCKRSYTSVCQHLRSQDCRKAYSKADLEDLKEAADWMRKQELSERYKKYKDEIAQKYQRKKHEISAKRQAKKDEISKKNADYYRRNGLKIRWKAHEYYAKKKEGTICEESKSKEATKK